MNDKEQGEKLIAIETKLTTLIKQFDKISNGVGFPRCVERDQRIRQLEERMKDQKIQNQKLQVGVITGIIIIVLQFISRFIVF